MRACAEAWPDPAIVQQAVGQLPWGHNIVLLTRLKDPEWRLTYAQQAIEHGWSRNVLNIHIETQRIERKGKAVTNFNLRLPQRQSDLARESLTDPYRLDFLGLGKEAEERAIETALVQHITHFFIELGAGFAFVGRQVPLEVGGNDFFIDLLFYHLKLRCYVVVELKAGSFKPEHTGKLGFYLSAVDAQIKHPDDQPTIGLLLCKSKNTVVAEYALRDSNKPIGFSCSNVISARQFYLAYPKGATLSHLLGWSHGVELLKLDAPLDHKSQTLGATLHHDHHPMPRWIINHKPGALPRVSLRPFRAGVLGSAPKERNDEHFQFLITS
jgi:predicted nuclease of restriction endonuclease-like (RecB) superfamily